MTGPMLGAGAGVGVLPLDRRVTEQYASLGARPLRTEARPRPRHAELTVPARDALRAATEASSDVVVWLLGRWEHRRSGVKGPQMILGPRVASQRELRRLRINLLVEQGLVDYSSFLALARGAAREQTFSCWHEIAESEDWSLRGLAGTWVERHMAADYGDLLAKALPDQFPIVPLRRDLDFD